MIFTGIDNQTVEFRITNYQFPENTEGGWDGNWLNIYLKINSKFGKWHVTDPSLTTWEVQELIEWFEQIANFIEPLYKLMSFTEPNLSFELLNESSDNQKHIRIQFELELRPSSATIEKAYYVDLVVDSEDLKEIIEGLKKELLNFPVRKT